MLVEVAGRRLVQDLAVPDDEDAVGEPEDLLDLAGHDDDGDAVVGEPTDEGVDLGAGADVDAAGGLVEQQDAAAAQQPPGEHDLLLVAAGEGADLAGDAGRTQLEARGELLRRAAFSAPRSIQAAPREAGEAWPC